MGVLVYPVLVRGDLAGRLAATLNKSLKDRNRNPNCFDLGNRFCDLGKIGFFVFPMPW